MRLILLCLFLCSCGKAIDPEFHSYALDFAHLMTRHGINKPLTSIEFGNTDGKAGICKHPGNYVLIDQARWNNHTETAKRTLIYHELGHCIGNLEHDQVFIPDPHRPNETRPRSIMFGILYQDYERDPDYYNNELMQKMRPL